MRRREINLLLLIVIIAIFAGVVDYINDPAPILTSSGKYEYCQKSFFGLKPIQVSRGIDLSGGTQLLLQGDPPEGLPIPPENLNTARNIIEKRINTFGVGEPIVQTQPPDRIIVEIPGIPSDSQIESLKNASYLQFVDIGQPAGAAKGDVIATDKIPVPALPETSTTTLATPLVTASCNGATTLPTTPDGSSSLLTGTGLPIPPGSGALTVTPSPIGSATKPLPDPHAIRKSDGGVFQTIITGDDIQQVQVDSSGGAPRVTFSLKSGDATKRMADFTTNNTGHYMAIVIDNKVIDAPVVNNPITGGEGTITGLTAQQASDLAVQIQYGRIPIPFKLLSQHVIGPTLGAEAIQRSLFAGLAGIFIVMLFMIVYYRLPGLLADIALILYALLSLAVFKLIPVTLTAAGIAGFILSIGMAVDANVLIFSRMKEELRLTGSMREAIAGGFHHAWPSIRDSNISTILTCIVLYWFGSVFVESTIQGFAVTLFIGILVSLFSALVVTRTLLYLALSIGLLHDPRLSESIDGIRKA